MLQHVRYCSMYPIKTMLPQSVSDLKRPTDSLLVRLAAREGLFDEHFDTRDLLRS